MQQGSNVVLLKARLPENLDGLALRVLGSRQDLQGVRHTPAHTTVVCDSVEGSRKVRSRGGWTGRESYK